MAINVFSQTLVTRFKSWSILSGSALVLLVFALIMVNFLNPLEIGPNGILVFFLLCYLLGVVVVLMGLKLCRILFKVRLSAIKSMYFSATIAFAPVMLLALNTLNQLQSIDIVLVVIFEALALFYVLRRLE